MILHTQPITYQQLTLLYGDPSISMSAPFVAPSLVGAALGYIDTKAKQLRLYCIEEDESENSIHIWNLPTHWQYIKIECFETIENESKSNQSSSTNTNVIIELSIEKDLGNNFCIKETPVSIHSAVTRDVASY